MARITTVKHAQTRYKTVPVIDPETGLQKVVPVTTRSGEPKMTRSKAGRPGRPITMRVTVPDKTRPKPPETCEACHEPIIPKGHPDYPGHEGEAYRWVKPKSGPYGGYRRVRHLRCGTWQPWDLSQSLGAQLQRVSYEFNQAIDTAESEDDVQAALDQAANDIEELADQREESGQNMEEGFQHETEQSSQLKQDAEDLRSWAQEIQGASIPELPEPEETECTDCGGTGTADQEQDADDTTQADAEDCETCGGSGQVTPDELSGDDLDAWREEVRGDLSIVDESPV